MANIERETFDREVEEEMRRERLEKIWKLYGTYVLAGAAAIVLGVGGVKWWQASHQAAAEAAGARYEAASELDRTGKSADATKAFEAIARDGPAGYAQLASLRVAGHLAKSGKTAEAVAAYEAAAKANGTDQLLAGFAKLQAATLRLGTADFTEMENRLNELGAEKGPWRIGARELLGLAAWKAGKIDEARRLYEQLLGEKQLPPGVGERARIMMSEIVAAELARSGAPAPAATKDTAGTGSAGTKPAPAAAPGK